MLKIAVRIGGSSARSLGIATACVAAMGVSLASAQQTEEAGGADAAPRSDWIVNCSSAGTSDRLVCQMSQTLTQTETGLRVLTVTIRQGDGEGDGLAMVLALPHGMSLPAGVSLRVDEGELAQLPVQTSDANGVYAATPLGDGMIATLRAGTSLQVGMRAATGQDVAVPVSLAGFSAALDKLVDMN